MQFEITQVAENLSLSVAGNGRPDYCPWEVLATDSACTAGLKFQKLIVLYSNNLGISPTLDQQEAE